MTKTEIAVLAIKGLGPIGNSNGGQVIEIMRSLKMSTDEAAILNTEVRRLAVQGDDNMDFAKEYVNRYTRDFRYR